MRRGRFDQQRKELKVIIQSLFFWALVFVFNILWFSIKLPAPPKSPMYLAEKIWFLSFCISMLQQLSVPVLLAIVGYFSPRLLLQDFAILLVNLLFSWLTFQVLTVFSLVLFVDLLGYFLSLQGRYVFGGDSVPSTTEEKAINVIARMSQAAVGIGILFFL